MSCLPEGWEKFNSTQQFSALFTAISSSSSQLNQRFSDLAGVVDDFIVLVKQQSEKLNALENENKSLRLEIEQLKELHVNNQPCSDLKVTGIPRSCEMQLKNISQAILEKLNVEASSCDILEVREFKPNHQKCDPEMQTNQRMKPYNETFSYVMQFKSPTVRDHVLKAKRRFGELKFSDIAPNGDYESKIGLHELLPRSTHNLRLLAKERAKQHEYKHVWTYAGNIFVRKDDGSDRVSIVTKSDLLKII